MIEIAVFRRVGREEIPLVEGPRGYLCCEGDTIVFAVRSSTIPELSLRAEGIVWSDIQHIGDHYKARFEKLIDVWAGRTCFHLRDGANAISVWVDVRPRGNKLNEDAWEAMVDELARIGPGLPWGLSPGDGAAVPINDDLSVIHPAIMERYLPRFSALLRTYLSAPPTVARRTRTIAPLDTGRRVDLGTLRWLSRHPQQRLAFCSVEVANAATHRSQVELPAVYADLNHAMTGYVRYLLIKLEARLKLTSRALRQTRQHGVPDPALTRYAKLMAERLDSLTEEVVRAERHPVIRAANAAPANDSILQSLPDHPLWSGIHRVARILLHPGLLYAPRETLFSALKHSYDLFEIFVLYRLVEALRAALPAEWHEIASGELARLPLEDRPKDRALWIWNGPDGAKLELHYQPPFRTLTGGSTKGEFKSITALGVPDYVLIHRKKDDSVAWIVLDAKYRSSRQSIHDALADMHIYRDKLRLGSMVASAAFIIVPALDRRAGVYGAAEYLHLHKLGALVINRSDWLRPVLNGLRLNMHLI